MEKELNENQLIFVDEKGNEILCDIIFTYDSEEFKKSYVFFAPVGSEDEEGKVEVGVASYELGEDGKMGELHAVETDEEWDMLAEVFDSFASEECDCEECDCEECGCEDECAEDGCSCGCCHHHEK